MAFRYTPGMKVDVNYSAVKSYLQLHSVAVLELLVVNKISPLYTLINTFTEKIHSAYDEMDFNDRSLIMVG